MIMKLVARGVYLIKIPIPLFPYRLTSIVVVIDLQYSELS